MCQKAPMTRNEVFQHIQGERLHQQLKWKVPEVDRLRNECVHQTSLIDGDKEEIEWSHDILSWIGMMEVYLIEAKQELTHFGRQVGQFDALHELRKVVALGVACLEQHGCPPRRVESEFPKDQNLLNNLINAVDKVKEEMVIEGIDDFTKVLDAALNAPLCDNPLCAPCNQKRLKSKDDEVARLKKLIEKSLVTNPLGSLVTNPKVSNG